MDSPRPDDDGFELTLLSRDELETQVRERTAYLENLMDTMVDVLLVLGADGQIELANEAITDVLGYDEADVVGSPVDAIFAPPKTNEELSDMLTDGAFVERLLTEGSLTDAEIYFSTQGGDPVPMSVSASVMEDAEGAVTGIVCVAKDISERKEAEETAAYLHSLLRHDLGNKLQTTKGFLQLIREEEQLPSGADEHIETALRSLDEAAMLIEDVRVLERIDGDQPLQPVSLDDVIATCIGRHGDLREQRDITIDNGVDDGHTVLANSLLKELFSNLLENALLHSAGSTIELAARETDDAVIVTQVDDGVGIPDEQKDRIFEKRFRGPESSGSGLGMHLVERIVEAHDGEIEVSDAEAGGARFDVTLPRPDRG